MSSGQRAQRFWQGAAQVHARGAQVQHQFGLAPLGHAAGTRKPAACGAYRNVRHAQACAVQRKIQCAFGEIVQGPLQTGRNDPAKTQPLGEAYADEPQTALKAEAAGGRGAQRQLPVQDHVVPVQVQTHVLQQYAPGRAVGHGRRAREPEGQDHAVLAQLTAQDRA